VLPDSELLVVCLCAEWCVVCREYRARFEQVRAQWPGVAFRWVDIEDESDLVDPVEVDDFPTLLILRGSAPAFFGTVPRSRKRSIGWCATGWQVPARRRPCRRNCLHSPGDCAPRHDGPAGDCVSPTH
jgi:hypothetical protein